MPGASSPSLHPAALPPGTVVGSWRVVDWAGRGSHGAVYRAVHVDKEHASPVALKLALIPRNPRLQREAELLSRTRHPSVPRLWEAGEWHHPGGDFYPYLVMEWIDGVPLYAWARQHSPSAQQTLRLLAQLARALQSVHAHSAVHRDVKGDNVLMRRSDSRAMLIDFGSGLYPEASTLTPPDMYPGTPAYRSPESGLFELQSLRDRSARYRAGPSDDLYALGTMACRLLTGEYPAFADPIQDERGTWHLEAVKPPPSLLEVEAPLRDLVLRMLSVRPEARGSVAQMAEALEQASHLEQSPPPSPSSPALARPWWPWCALAASSLMLVIGVGWTLAENLLEPSSSADALLSRGGRTDGPTSGLAEAASKASAEEAPKPALHDAMAQETLPEPLPAQTRPDAKGRCPHKRQVALNGACWIPFEPEECEASFARADATCLPSLAAVPPPRTHPISPRLASC
jgi:eukaryotic-like serine/threonine-protein kinase